MRRAGEYEYDVAFSFAGENRDYVQAVYQCLVAAGVNVFYDQDYEVELWGKDLVAHLDDIYRNRARYCVMFISQHYQKKAWPNHERKSAQARAFLEQKGDYLLPARFDATEILGVLPTLGYIDLATRTPEAFAELILEKIGRKEPSGGAPSDGNRSGSVSVGRRLRVPPKGFNPYDEAAKLIRYIADGLREHCNAAVDHGVEFTEFEREGQTCMRILRGGQVRYSLNVWMGGLVGDASLAFFYQRGEPSFSSNSMHAWGTVEWSKTREEPVIPLDGFMGRMGQRGEYTYAAVLDALWDEICNVLEEEDDR